MPDSHKNFASSLVATAPSPATSGTSLVVTTGEGTKFPTAPFNATIWPTGANPTTANAEIVRVTAVSTDTLTITRAQEGTSARTVLVGDQIVAGITAKALTDVETASFNPQLALSPAGASYETFPRQSSGIGNQTGLISGRESLFAVAIPAGFTIGHIAFASGLTAAGTPTHWWFALHDNNRVQLATTADQTSTAWPATTIKSLAIATIASGASSTFTTTYSGIYYLGIMVAATTVPTLWGFASDSVSGALTPVLYAGPTPATGLTTPPAFPNTPGAAGTGGGLPYAYVGA